MNNNEVFNPMSWRDKIKVPPEPEADIPVVGGTGSVPVWSYSRLLDFEECEYRVFLAGVKKVKAESGDAANRGTQIHDAGEQYIRGESNELPKEYAHVKELMDTLRRANEETDGVELEENWGFTLSWSGTGFFDDDVWGRMKLDVFWRQSDTSATIIDWKTGKRFGNELKHTGQGQVYAIGAFERYPELEFVEVAFEYLDDKSRLVKHYTRKQMIPLRKMLEGRAIKMTSATDFRPSPASYNCKWCSVKADCEWAVE